jgi:hypothetical protein
MDTFLGLMLLGVALALYFLPTLICGKVDHRCGWAIFALNLFLGWTLLGWVVALVWSLIPDREAVGTHA